MNPKKEPVMYGAAAMAVPLAALPTPTMGALAGVPIGPILSLVSVLLGLLVRQFTTPATPSDPAK